MLKNSSKNYNFFKKKTLLRVTSKGKFLKPLSLLNILIVLSSFFIYNNEKFKIKY